MIDPKTLTPALYQTTLSKNGVKDNGLQRFLATYDKLGDDDHDENLKCVLAIIQQANLLKKAKDAAAKPAVVKYLNDLVATAEAEKKSIAATRAQAVKGEAAKQADDEKKKAMELSKLAAAEAEEEEEGDYPAKLLAAIQKLKSSKDVAFQCLICEAKPFVAAIIAKKLSPKHKEELTKVSGGSKRFLPPGTCQMLDGKLSLVWDKPVAGMARRLQDSIKHFTGKKFAVVIGSESAAAGDDLPKDKPAAAPTADEAATNVAAAKQAAEAAAKLAAAKAAAEERRRMEERRLEFKKARAVWVAAKLRAEADLEKVKDGARMQYLADPDQYPKIEKGCKVIDAILDNLDDELRDTLDQYVATPLSNAKKLQQLAASATGVLDGYRAYVANDPIMKAIDKKEFANVTVHAPIMKALNDLRKALT